MNSLLLAIKGKALIKAGISLEESEDYLVYDEGEREEAIKEYIKDSIWAFNADFILEHNSKILKNTNCKEYGQIINSIKKIQESLCESCNALILALIDNFEEFCADAVEADGYGHFLSPYDGQELEIEIDGQSYFIYRQN